MNKSRYVGWLVCALTLLFASYAGAAPGNLILNVPDWNQPDNYAAGTAGLNVGDYPGWCSPTAGGNLMGYWEDVMGCSGLTDQQAYNSSTAYPGTAGTWQQGLYHDGMIEMGWYMDTGTWQSASRPFPPGMGMTTSANILNGLLAYAHNGWTDNDYVGGGGTGTGIAKTAYPSAAGFTENMTMVGNGAITLQQMWTTYCGEIDVARPVECTFDHWVDPTVYSGPMTIDNFPNQTCETYPWDTNIDPHSVVGVGYIDKTQGFQNDGTDEWFVCQDGWPGPGAGAGGTGQYVAVPLDTNWQQNDYITDVPEPATMAILGVGGVGMLLRRRRK